MKPADRAALIGFLESRDVVLPPGWDDDTPLLESGVLDSAALFELIVWLEDRLGRPIDPTRFELSVELGSVAAILDFLKRRRAAGGDAIQR